jgi:hypothetical protein
LIEGLTPQSLPSAQLQALFQPSGSGVLHLIQINHQHDATIFQFIILTFVYSSTLFRAFSRSSSGAQ